MKKKSIIFILVMMLLCSALAVFSACKKKQTPTYHIYYSGGDGATGRAPEAAQFHEGDTVTLVENVFFQKAEYEFAGWAVLGKEYSVGESFKMPASDVTIEACWAQTVTLIYGFGINSHAAQSAVLPASVQQKIGTSVRLPAVEAESGYSFAGWVATGETLPRAAGSLFTLTENVTLTAKWVAWGQVTFNANGGTGADPLPIAYAAGETVLLDENPYQRSGYRFAGWSVTANGNAVAVHSDGNGYRFTMPEGDVAVSALWKQEHTLVYSYGEDGENHGVGTAPADSCRYVEGDCVELSSVASAATGWRFDGWQVSCVNGQASVSVSSGAFTMPDDDVVAIAGWSLIKYSVVYKSGDATNESVVEEITVESNGGKLILKNASLFEAQECTFSGWRIEDTDYAAGSAVDILDILPANGTVITVIAQWSDMFKAEYSFGDAGNAHGNGSVPVDSAEYAAGDSVSLYSGIVSAEKGWRFLNWEVTKKNDGSLVSVVSGAEGATFVMPAGGVLITAKWIEIGYTVVYLRGGHSVAESDITEDNVTISGNGGQYTLRSAYAAEDMYRFAGWRLGDKTYQAEEEVAFFELIPDAGEEIVFTAQWEELFGVSFDLSGGNWNTAVSPLTDCVVAADTVLDFKDFDEPQRTGYVFKGWLLMDAQENAVYRKNTFNSTYTVTAQTSFRAQWKKAVTVKFYDELGNLNANIAPVKSVVLEEGSVLGEIFPDLGMQVNWCLAVKSDGVYEFGQQIGSMYVIESSLIQDGDDAIYICASYE